jgi:hypothetical protein
VPEVARASYSFDIPGVNGSSNEFGADLGGGAESFFNRRVAMTFELLFHVVNTPTVVPGAAFNSRFWNFSVGAKRYFERNATSQSQRSSSFRSRRTAAVPPFDTPLIVQGASIGCIPAPPANPLARPCAGTLQTPALYSKRAVASGHLRVMSLVHRVRHRS